MEILVDADACPVIAQVENVAQKHNVPVTLLCDTSHILESEYSRVVMVDRGADSVDIVLVNNCNKGDIVVTQDYGVAAMALGKGAYAIHQSGKWFTNDNIDEMLFSRHIAKVMRNSKKKSHLKGGRKRNTDDDKNFEMSFERLILNVLGKNTLLIYRLHI